MPFAVLSGTFRVDQDGLGGGEGDTQVKVEALANGDYVFAWRELEDNLPDRFRIFVRKYSGTNVTTPLGDMVKIDGAMRDGTGNGFSTPSIAPFANGGFGVEYNDFGGGTNYSDGTPYTDRVWTWVAGFNADGQLVQQLGLLGAPNRNDPVQNRSIGVSSIISNGEGGYHTLALQGFPDPAARYVLVNGQEVDIGLAAAGSSVQVGADIADAGDGAFIVWNRGSSATDSDIYGMILGQPAVKLNTQTQGLQTISTSVRSIATLADGNFVVVWSDLSTQDEASDPGTGVRARIIGPDGVPIGDEIILPFDPAGDESRPMVVPMDNGYWVAIWNDERGTVGQVFTETGERYKEEVVLIEGHTGIPAATMLPGNKLVIAWQNRPADAPDETLAKLYQMFYSDSFPKSVDEEYDAVADQVLTIGAAAGVLANDVDLDGDPLSIQSLSGPPQHGTVTLNPDGSFTYTPNAGYVGKDSFVYNFTDGTGHFNAAQATITVRAQATLPSKLIDLGPNPYQNITAPAIDFDLSQITGPMRDLIISMLGVTFVPPNIVPRIGSLKLDIDTDNDGVSDTHISLETPQNVTINVAPDAVNNKTVISFDPLADATAGNDVINGTDGLDYIAGAAGNDTLRGYEGNDALSGEDGNDTLLPGKGIDAVKGGAGSDGIYFGKELDAKDRVEGGDGVDTLAIQGNYANLLLAGVTGIEVLFPLPGSDTRFGDINGASYDYVITSVDANVAAGGQMTVVGGNLRAGEDLSFDGSAETDGKFRIFAGQGNDTYKGGAGNDGFFFGADGNLTGADRVDGGGGTDSIALRGNYFGPKAVAFQDASFANVEVLTFLSGHTNEFGGFIDLAGFDYDVTLANGNIAAGGRLDVIAGTLRSNESARVDGRAELDGTMRLLGGAGDDILFGGQGADTLYGALGTDQLDGSGGADTYTYRAVGESTAASRDAIVLGDGDRIDLGFIDANGDAGDGNTAFAFIGSAAFGNVAGQLRAFESGGQWTVEADVNGDGTADLVIAVASNDAIVVGDFVL